MAQPDMHEHQLGQYQAQEDFYSDLDDAEARVYQQAKREALADTLVTLGAGGEKAADLMIDFDCSTANKDNLVPSAYDALAHLARHMAAGSIDAGLARVTQYLQAIAAQEAHSVAMHEATAFAEQAIRRAA